MTWDEVLQLPYLQNLPFKIEMNRLGQILMSPASNRHGNLQVEISYLIKSKLQCGKVITECSIQTDDGVKVADVAWASDQFVAEFGMTTPYPKAPEICVEIISPSNTIEEMKDKVTLYLANGALEVWLAQEDGSISFYNSIGRVDRSRLMGKFTLE